MLHHNQHGGDSDVKTRKQNWRQQREGYVQSDTAQRGHRRRPSTFVNLGALRKYVLLTRPFPISLTVLRRSTGALIPSSSSSRPRFWDKQWLRLSSDPGICKTSTGEDLVTRVYLRSSSPCESNRVATQRVIPHLESVGEVSLQIGTAESCQEQSISESVCESTITFLHSPFTQSA